MIDHAETNPEGTMPHLPPLMLAAGLLSLGTALLQMVVDLHARLPSIATLADIPMQFLPALLAAGWPGLTLAAVMFGFGYWKEYWSSQAHARAQKIKEMEGSLVEAKTMILAQSAKMDERDAKIDTLHSEIDTLHSDLSQSRENNHAARDKFQGIIFDLQAELRELKSKHGGAINLTNESVHAIAQELDPPLEVPEVHVNGNGNDEPPKVGPSPKAG